MSPPRPLRSTLAAALRDGLAGSMPLLGVLGAAAWLWITHPLERHGALLDAGLLLIALLQVGHLALQSVLYARYRPFAPGEEATLPSVTVVIPAYNEGPMVRRSIESVARARYPKEKLEVVVVDDGSRDDTYFYMEQVRRDFPSLVRLIHFPGNRGKRAALYEGFRAARGEVVVTIDSDSEIEPETLRHLVAPFQADARVGAVAGRVAVLNRESLLGAMLDVNYTLAFDFARAAQSTYGAVACCPGALSAFRRELILPHLGEWLSQSFWGRPVNHGEDQALTNLVLRAGFETVYQRDAVIHTLAPERYRQLCKMFLRWERSFVVEGFSFARFMFTRYRPRRRLLPALNFVLGNLRLLALYAGLLAMPVKLLESPSTWVDYAMAMMIASTLTALYYVRREFSLRFVFGVVYAFYAFFLLQWILPWAVVTVREEGWGTR
jgi:hyaluronan synthase